MRNKLKETKKNQNANDRPPLAVGPYLTLVLSDHGDSNGPHGAGDTLFTAPSRLGRKMTGCPENTKLAPVFSRRMPKGKSKESGDEELHHPVEKLSIVLPPSEQQLSTSTVSQTERKESWREQLSSSALHSCLKDIQESNAAFPVQRLFGVLQTKARKALQDGGSTGNIGLQNTTVIRSAFTAKYISVVLSPKQTITSIPGIQRDTQTIRGKRKVTAVRMRPNA